MLLKHWSFKYNNCVSFASKETQLVIINVLLLPYVRLRTF